MLQMVTSNKHFVVNLHNYLIILKAQCTVHSQKSQLFINSAVTAKILRDWDKDRGFPTGMGMNVTVIPQEWGHTNVTHAVLPQEYNAIMSQLSNRPDITSV